MTTHRARLERLEQIASLRTPDTRHGPSRWPTLRDLPTIRWDDLDAGTAFTADVDLCVRLDAAKDAGDVTDVARLSPDALDAALRVYSVIPRPDETPDHWRARLDRLPVFSTYVDRSAVW